MMPSGTTKFRAPPQSLFQSTSAIRCVPMPCFTASIRTMNATDRKYRIAGMIETVMMVL